MKRAVLTVLASALVLSAPGFVRAADDMDKEYKEVVKRGLDFVANSQHRDGHWDANGGQYPTTMTAMGGMALLMEGSTLREGKYADRLRRCTEWLVDRCQANGLIGNPNNQTESMRYMYGHGFGMLFLASVYGDEEDERRRKQLEEVLTKAVKFCGESQTNRGGWGYVSAKDGQNFDEGSVTVTQLQGLRAARNAGIVVPKKIIDEATKYLEKCTTPKGGVIYSLAQGGAFNGAERPPLTAAAISCSFSAGEYDSGPCKKWLEYCKTAIPVGQAARSGHDEYTHYYYAQALYILGDDGFGKLFPESKQEERLTWTKYRKTMFEHLKNTQAKDGSWSGGYVGPIFSTTIYLTVLQLENNTLPIYQR